jgi:hypothetical protein
MHLQQIRRWLQTSKQRDQDGTFASFENLLKALGEKENA